MKGAIVTLHSGLASTYGTRSRSIPNTKSTFSVHRVMRLFKQEKIKILCAAEAVGMVRRYYHTASIYVLIMLSGNGYHWYRPHSRVYGPKTTLDLAPAPWSRWPLWAASHCHHPRRTGCIQTPKSKSSDGHKRFIRQRRRRRRVRVKKNWMLRAMENENLVLVDTDVVENS